MTSTVQRWTGHVAAFEGGGFVSYGDYLELKKEVEALRADAEKWRAYKARKDEVINDGMGRNPLRNEGAFDTLPDDYEVN